MNNKSVLLLKTFLQSTSQINIIKTSTDKKKRSHAVGSLIGMGFLYLLLLAYCILMSIGYGIVGLTEAMPSMLAMVLTLLAFFFTLLKSNSYLYGFREYGLLMSMPFREKTIVGCKFLYMYLKSLPWYLTMSVAFLIGYGIYARPGFLIYPLWMVLSLILPVLPMLAASLLSFVVVRVSTTFKYWKAIQAILLFAFIGLCFFSRFFIEKLFRNNEVADLLSNTSSLTAQVETWYLPAKWFHESISEGKLSGVLLLIGVTILCFELVFLILSRSYIRLNSIMMTSAVRHVYKERKQRRLSAAMSMAGKETRHFFGSVAFLVNGGIGYVMALAIGIICLFVGLDKVIATITAGAPVSADMIKIAIPFIVYFFTGMMALTTSSPSLEGKNIWILQTLPITVREVALGRILSNLFLSVPAQTITTVFLCIAGKAGLAETILYVLFGLVLCVFSATFGLACGLRFLRLDWENEIEVIKQGTAVVIYMFPNMILTLAMLVGSIILSLHIGKTPVLIAAILIYSLLTVFSAMSVRTLARRGI